MKLRKSTLNLLLDLFIFASFLVEAVSGFVLWLVLTGGYKGGRNPSYGRVFLLSRDAWLDLHDWFAVAMTGGIVIHIILHWRWITSMISRAWRDGFGARVPVADDSRGSGAPATK